MILHLCPELRYHAATQRYSAEGDVRTVESEPEDMAECIEQLLRERHLQDNFSTNEGVTKMTISIKVSVNGNYKIPVTVKYGDSEPTTDVISGRGLTVPFVKDIPYYHHTGNIVVISVGPEEPDNG